MDFNQWPLLTILTFLPLIGAIAVFLIPKEDHDMQRNLALIFTLATFAVSVLLWIGFRVGTDAPLFQFVQDAPWIPMLGSRYHVGIDGVSLLLILLTTLLMVLCVLSSYTAITEKVKSYYAFLLMLETGMLGVFIARDVLLFYVFWEAMLIPMYFLRGVWGGTNRIRAAIKFFLYTMVGSLLMLVSILVLYFYHLRTTGVATFDLYQLQQGTAMPGVLQGWLFFAFFLAFAIKVPMFPFHTWLPEAHVEAPTAGSVILAGVLLKMGTYGFFRYAMPLFPEATRYWGYHTDIYLPLFPISLWPFQFYWLHYTIPLVIVLSIIGIIYGALVAMVQKDVKKLVAYSSVSHLGFVMLGLFALNAQGVMGSLLQSINHGISTGALFLLIGFIYERRHTREISEFGGLWTAMPAYGTLFVISMFSSVALPGLNGFVGEFPILLGAFARHPLYGVLGATGVVLGAIYLLWMFQRVFQGPLTEANRNLKDLTSREWAVMLPLILLMFGIGLYPKPLTDRLEPAVDQFLAHLNAPPMGKVAIFPPENQSGITPPTEVISEPAPADIPPDATPPAPLPFKEPPGHEGHGHP